MIARPRGRMALFLVAILCLFAAACTPEQIAIYRAATPEQQERIVAEVQRQQAETQFYLGIIAARERASTDCYAAMRTVWPAHLHSWASGIIHRESRGYHAAANTSSTARGCFQLLLSLHSHRYTAVGCSPSQWADAVCNARAALHLYQQAGTSPWRV